MRTGKLTDRATPACCQASSLPNWLGSFPSILPIQSWLVSTRFWLEPGIARQLFGIYLIALPIAVRNRTQLTDVGHNDFVAKLLQLLTDPYRMRSSLHRHTRRQRIREPFLNGLGRGSKTTSIDYFTVFVENAVMTPDIAKINAYRQHRPGLSRWNFCDPH
jgi:hypothetical protein